MALGDPPYDVPPNPIQNWGPTALPSSTESDQDPEEQWLFQFHEHLLLTVQAVYRLRQALAEKMP